MEQHNSTVVASNISSSPGYLSLVSWDSSALVPSVLLSLCFLLGVPGNISVVVLKSKWQHVSSLSQTLMLNLAMADLLCLLTLPLWIYSFLRGWIFGLVACKLLTYLVYCSIYCSLLTVTMLSVQRYLQVVYLQRCLGPRGQRRLLVLLWLAALILATPALVIKQVITDKNQTQCETQYTTAQMLPVLLTESFTGFTSVFVVMFAYICIRRKVNQGAFFHNPQTSRLITSIIVSFFVLWTPYLIIDVLGIAAFTFNNNGLLTFCTDSWDTAGAMVFLNSCIDPFLYAFASRSSCTMCQNPAPEQHR